MFVCDGSDVVFCDSLSCEWRGARVACEVALDRVVDGRENETRLRLRCTAAMTAFDFFFLMEFVKGLTDNKKE